jgi:hypothetical protein
MIPMFYVVVSNMVGRFSKRKPQPEPAAHEPSAADLTEGGK